MNFPPTFIRWIEIIYKNIKSKVLINGALYDEINVTRSIRQGCPLNICFYAIVIEALTNKVRNNEQIQGIAIPNHSEKIKLFQNADDCSMISTNLKDYDLMVKAFNDFGSVSGSKINETKTEILKIGNPNTTDFQNLELLSKESVKLFGIYFGKKQSGSKLGKEIKCTYIISKL
ncbi:unnamed protein product [Mytilus coruscus]|uniref:Reverse transcriptase domain-containing protein n=1 Tax=Mytilus coruscus TaxID=42192 RepID=A0A6J8EHS0_MYTCO|nr:unnamed protein product [Mytilus coruscus]